MMRTLLSSLCACAIFVFASAASLAAPRYYEWQTNRPFSGWVGVGPHSYYCDYIRYPVRRCGPVRVCKRGKCWTRQNCRVVGWRIMQSCS